VALEVADDLRQLGGAQLRRLRIHRHLQLGQQQPAQPAIVQPLDDVQLGALGIQLDGVNLADAMLVQARGQGPGLDVHDAQREEILVIEGGPRRPWVRRQQRAARIGVGQEQLLRAADARQRDRNHRDPVGRQLLGVGQVLAHRIEQHETR
jgi:hypothetical protein